MCCCIIGYSSLHPQQTSSDLENLQTLAVKAGIFFLRNHHFLKHSELQLAEKIFPQKIWNFANKFSSDQENFNISLWDQTCKEIEEIAHSFSLTKEDCRNLIL